MRLITEILQLVIEGRSVRQIADKLGLTTEAVLSRLQTMERMGLLSTEEDLPGSGCAASKCRSCCGCGASQAARIKQYHLTEKGKRMVSQSAKG